VSDRYRTATQWGVYDVDVEDGRIVDVQGIGQDPAPSGIGENLKDAIQHPLRIDRPHVRKAWLDRGDRSLRGRDEFVAVSWEEALSLAADEIRRVIDEKGNTAIFGGSYGWASAGRFHHAQSQLHRFLNLLGGCTRAMNTYSTAAAQVVLPHVVAPWEQMELEQTPWQEICEHTELFVAFGGVPLRNTQVAYGGITEHQATPALAAAVERGVRFLNVSPLQNDAPNSAEARWIPCRPGTDVALMLGIAYVLDTEGLADLGFLSSHCVGYSQVRAYLLGETDGIPKTPQWAQAICSVQADEIVSLARMLARHRTFIACAWSLQRADHGEQPYWMAVTLAGMLGQIGLPGGGFGFGYGAEGHIGSNWRRFHWATFPKGYNKTGSAIPVARIADMLVNPGQTVAYNGREITYPDIDLIYWAGGNPFHHHQDLNRLVTAWREPATVIVNEPWWTPIAQWADIVFPATTSLEREDICASSHDPYAHAMEQVIPPQGEARSDHEIFKGLAKELGILTAFTEGKTEREWMADMWRRSQERAIKEGFELPSFDEFWREGSVAIPPRDHVRNWLLDFRTNPAAHPLNTPSGKIELFSETVASFGYDDCPGHAVWIEPFERLGRNDSKYRLHLLTPQPARKLHSQLDHGAFSREAKIHGKEALRIHPDAARERGVEDGDVVRVFNDRGACLAGIEIDAKMRKDVVVLPTGSWFNSVDGLETNGNPNVLTRDKGTSSLAQGPSAHTCLVEVVPWDET
jgi:biotin/methionine sulfoxide reductase